MAASKATEAHIPVIDISNHDPQVGDDLIAAVVKWGFVYVRGHIGFSAHEIDKVFEIVRFTPI